MRLTSFVVWKSWASNPVRTFLTVLGIALGIAVVTAIHVLDHNTIQSLLQQRRADYGRIDLELLAKTDRPIDEVRRELALHPSIASVGLLHAGAHGAPARLAAAAEGDGAEPRTTSVRLYGLHPLPDAAFSLYEVAAGRDLSELDGDGGVLIGPSLAATQGIEVGSRIQLHPPDVQSTEHCIDGQLVHSEAPARKGRPISVEVKGILAPYGIAQRYGGMIVIGSFPLAARINPGLPVYYQINRVAGADPDRLKAHLSEQFQVVDARSAMIGEASDERAFRNGIKLLGLLALVMGMLVVFQTLSQTLMERLQQIGVMRCLGASRQAISAIFLWDAVLLAALGSGIGLLLGIGLAWLMAQNEWTTLGVGKSITDFEVPLRPLLFAAGLGMFFTLAGTAFPLFKARNLAPMRILEVRGLGDDGYLLRGVNLFLFVLLVVVIPIAYLAMTPLLSEEGRETRLVLLQVAGIVGLFGAVLLVVPKTIAWGGRLVLAPFRRRLPLPVFLVDKAMQRSPGRFSAAACGLGIVLVAIIAIQHISWALRAEVQQFSAIAMDDHLFLAGTVAVPLDRLQALRRIPGVLHVEHQTVEVATVEPDIAFQLRGLPADDLAAPGAILAGDAKRIATYRDRRSLIVSKRWAELHQKQVGQDVHLLTDGGVRRYEVLLHSDAAGFFPDERAWAVAAPHWLQQDFCIGTDSIRHVALHLDPERHAAAGAAATGDAGTSEAGNGAAADNGAASNGAASKGDRQVGRYVDDETLRAAASRIFPHTWKSGADIRGYLLRDVTKDFLLFDVLLLLVLLLVGMGLVNTMTIAAMGRAREIGVLRALGLGDRALWATFLLEGLVVAVLAAVLAIAMGIPLGRVVVFGLNRVTGLDAPVVLPWPWLLAVPLLAIATGLVAAILPGSRAVRIPPGEAVRYP